MVLIGTTKSDWADDYNEQRPHSALGYLTRRLMPLTSPQHAIGCATRTSSVDRMLLYPRRAA
jgi:transposase InsO family protein